MADHQTWTGVTELTIRLAVVRAESVFFDRCLFVVLSAVIQEDIVNLFILFCTLACCLRDPPGDELNAQILSHRRAALRLMVLVVLVEYLLLYRTLTELLVEAVSLAWAMATILWAYVSNVIRTGAIGDGKAMMNEIIAKFYW